MSRRTRNGSVFLAAALLATACHAAPARGDTPAPPGREAVAPVALAGLIGSLAATGAAVVITWYFLAFLRVADGRQERLLGGLQDRIDLATADARELGTQVRHAVADAHAIEARFNALAVDLDRRAAAVARVVLACESRARLTGDPLARAIADAGTVGGADAPTDAEAREILRAYSVDDGVPYYVRAFPDRSPRSGAAGVVDYAVQGTV